MTTRILHFYTFTLPLIEGSVIGECPCKVVKTGTHSSKSNNVLNHDRIINDKANQVLSG